MQWLDPRFATNWYRAYPTLECPQHMHDILQVVHFGHPPLAGSRHAETNVPWPRRGAPSLRGRVSRVVVSSEAALAPAPHPARFTVRLNAHHERCPRSSNQGPVFSCLYHYMHRYVSSLETVRNPAEHGILWPWGARKGTQHEPFEGTHHAAPKQYQRANNRSCETLICNMCLTTGLWKEKGPRLRVW
jgi:hypothetical protein